MPRGLSTRVSEESDDDVIDIKIQREFGLFEPMAKTLNRQSTLESVSYTARHGGHEFGHSVTIEIVSQCRP